LLVAVGVVTAPQRPGSQITEEDVRAAIDAVRDYNTASDPAQVRVMATQLRFAVESTLRPGGLVARALDAAAARVVADCSHDDYRLGQWPPETCPFCAPKVASVRAVAAEWREGPR
jgi:hypothetical protein